MKAPMGLISIAYHDRDEFVSNCNAGEAEL